MRVSGVAVRFGGIYALNNIDLVVRDGEIHGLIGPNGAGKTTLFDVISGLRSPSAGRVEVGGVDVTGVSAMGRARGGLRRTFQRQQVFSWLTVEDNVLMALEWRRGAGGLFGDLLGLPGTRRLERGRREQVREVLHRFGIDHLRDTCVGTLPIGGVRLVELARAVVDDPALVLLDEPTSGLEAAEVERVAEIVRAQRDRTSCAVILVEHDIEFVLGLCDRVSVLEAGEVISRGTPDEVRHDPEVRRAYLG